MIGAWFWLNEFLWGLVIAGALVLEYAGRKDSGEWHTLTWYIRKYVPKVLIAAAIVWLAAHFDVAGM